jgi:hypothetical protein
MQKERHKPHKNEFIIIFTAENKTHYAYELKGI